MTPWSTLQSLGATARPSQAFLTLKMTCFFPSAEGPSSQQMPSSQNPCLILRGTIYPRDPHNQWQDQGGLIKFSDGDHFLFDTELRALTLGRQALEAADLVVPQASLYPHSPQAGPGSQPGLNEGCDGKHRISSHQTG